MMDHDGRHRINNPEHEDNTFPIIFWTCIMSWDYLPEIENRTPMKQAIMSLFFPYESFTNDWAFHDNLSTS